MLFSSSLPQAYIFEIVEVVPDPAIAPTRWYKLRLRCRDDAKGPVTAVCGFQGYLVSSMGQKVRLFFHPQAPFFDPLYDLKVQFCYSDSASFLAFIHFGAMHARFGACFLGFRSIAVFSRFYLVLFVQRV